MSFLRVAALFIYSIRVSLADGLQDDADVAFPGDDATARAGRLEQCHLQGTPVSNSMLTRCLLRSFTCSDSTIFLSRCGAAGVFVHGRQRFDLPVACHRPEAMVRNCHPCLIAEFSPVTPILLHRGLAADMRGRLFVTERHIGHVLAFLESK